MNIVGMLPYAAEQSFCKILTECATSSYKTLCNWNPLLFSGEDSIIFPVHPCCEFWWQLGVLPSD